jgi:hypothetical protein
MAEEGEKSSRPKADDSSVLGSLSATRRTRLSRHARDDDSAGAKAQAAAAKAPAAKPKAVKPPAKPKAVRAPARAKAEAPATTVTAQAAGRPPAPEAATAPRKAGPAAGPPRPQAIRAGHPTLAEPTAAHPCGTPGGVQAVKTVVKAAGEVASLGVSIGGQVLKRVIDRLPKP